MQNKKRLTQPVSGTVLRDPGEVIARQLLDTVAYPLIVVAHTSDVIYANRAGAEATSGSNGLVVREGRLTATRRETAQTLARLIAASADTEAERAKLGVVRLDARPVKPASLALVMPVSAENAALTTTLQRLALVTLLGPTHRALPDELLVSEVYGLSAAEARLAVRIAAGRSLAQIAAEGGTSPHTVRTQLKAVFSKTGVSRQAELALSLAALAPVMMLAPRLQSS